MTSKRIIPFLSLLLLFALFFGCTENSQPQDNTLTEEQVKLWQENLKLQQEGIGDSWMVFSPEVNVDSLVKAYQQRHKNPKE